MIEIKEACYANNKKLIMEIESILKFSIEIHVINTESIGELINLKFKYFYVLRFLDK